MIIETDIGRDADDLFALLWLYEKKVKIDAITITPGDPDQIAVVRCLNYMFDKDVPIGIPDLSRNKSSSNPFHQEFIKRHSGVLAGKADDTGVELLNTLNGLETDDILVIGPCTNVGKFLTGTIRNVARMTMQGGFLPCEVSKFAGMQACPTFNLNGDRPNGLNFINYPYVSIRQMVGKNVGHFKCIWENGRKFKSELLQDTFNLFSQYSDSKKLQDPMAMICHFYPETGTWVRGKTIKSKGGWTTELREDGDFILSDIDEEKFWQFYDS